MAYIDKTRKLALAKEIAKVVPAGWKYSLAVRNHSTLVLTIKQAPVDLVADYRKMMDSSGKGTKDWPQDRYYCNPNTHYPKEQFYSWELRCAFEDIVKAMNIGNHDNSDPMSDYFDVGWYTEVHIGRWDDPFLHVLPKAQKAPKAPSSLLGAYEKKAKAKASKQAFPKWKLEKYLPDNFASLSPGKKAAATKQAIKNAAAYG